MASALLYWSWLIDIVNQAAKASQLFVYVALNLVSTRKCVPLSLGTLATKKKKKTSPWYRKTSLHKDMRSLGNIDTMIACDGYLWKQRLLLRIALGIKV